MTLTIQGLQGLRAWFRGVGTPDLRTQDKNDIYLALDELLAYREGYDPAERLPELGQVIKIEYRFPGNYTQRAQSAQKLARYDGAKFTDLIYPDTYIPLSWVTRWYPAPGGGRDDTR